VALGFSLSLLFRSNAVGIAGAIGIRLLEPALWALLGLLTDTFESIQKFGLEYPSSLLANLSTTWADPVTTSEAWRAAGVLSVWTAIFVGLTYYVFNRRDVAG
jgi:ABC-type transport system involved in multi-copper enzyme maturation permease subunit